MKIRLGPFKGCKGRVVDIKGTSVRVELEAQMKVVTGKCFSNVENSLIFSEFFFSLFFFGWGGVIS